MLQGFWPEIPPEENPVSAITNGVHLPTFLATEWSDTFDRFLGVGWQHRLEQANTWEQIRAIPDHVFWSVRQYLKSQMLELVHQRVRQQHYRNQESESHVDRLLRYADPRKPNVLTVGFAKVASVSLTNHVLGLPEKDLFLALGSNAAGLRIDFLGF